MGVTVRKAKIELSPEGHRLLSDLIIGALQEQARQSISGTGGALVGVNGNYVDLKQSGDLWRDKSYTGRGYRLNVDYASFLEERFRFAALAPQTWERIKPEAKRIIQQHLIVTEQ